MALSFKDDETDALARRLAHLTGESLTTAVRNALAERVERIERERSKDETVERVKAIARQFRAGLQERMHSLDHGDPLYDEHGLPK